MNSHSNDDLTPKEIRDYGFARARDIAFDAIHSLWRKRVSEGLKQVDVVHKIDRNKGWVSKNLNGPGNWTLRTLGELAEALDGDLEIKVHPREEAPYRLQNYTAYASMDAKKGPQSLVRVGQSIESQSPHSASGKIGS